MSSLTDSTVRAAKPRERPYKLRGDGHGLFLIVTPAGGKWWRFRYRHDGKESSLSLGVYPQVSLKQARARRDEARRLLSDGVNPSAQRKAKKAARDGSGTLEVVAQEWHASRSSGWTVAHAAKVLGQFAKDVFPWLGKCLIAEITAPQLLEVLRRIEDRGAAVIARRTLSDISRVFAYAIGTSRCTRNPAADIRGVLSPAQQGKHHAAITEPKKIGGLLRSIDGYEGSAITRNALKLAALTFVRPGELRRAEWQEIEFDAATWRIPAARMKMRQVHKTNRCA